MYSRVCPHTSVRVLTLVKTIGVHVLCVRFPLPPSGSLKSLVSFAKELYKRDDILPKRPSFPASVISSLIHFPSSLPSPLLCLVPLSLFSCLSSSLPHSLRGLSISLFPSHLAFHFERVAFVARVSACCLTIRQTVCCGWKGG